MVPGQNSTLHDQQRKALAVIWKEPFCWNNLIAWEKVIAIVGAWWFLLCIHKMQNGVWYRIILRNRKQNGLWISGYVKNSSRDPTEPLTVDCCWKIARASKSFLLLPVNDDFFSTPNFFAAKNRMHKTSSSEINGIEACFKFGMPRDFEHFKFIPSDNHFASISFHGTSSS